MKKRIKMTGIALLFIIVSLILITRFVLPPFLAFHHPVESTNLLIESWISAREIEQAAEYGLQENGTYHYFINGFNYPDVDNHCCMDSIFISDPETTESGSGVWLLTNGSLQIHIPENLNCKTGDTVVFNLLTKGKVVAGYAAHFNVIINGHRVGGGFTQEEPEYYQFNWVAGHLGLQSVFIRFNNDLWTHSGDRNLFVSSINIADQHIKPGPENSRIIYDSNIWTTGFNSQADEMADYLIALDLDPSRITILRFDPVQQNQTRVAAMAFVHYLEQHSISSINVVTSGFHSRRTWVTYKTLAGNNTTLGVLFFPMDAAPKYDHRFSYRKDLQILNEFISYFSNWIVLHL
jgi:hypothetical protein